MSVASDLAEVEEEPARAAVEAIPVAAAFELEPPNVVSSSPLPGNLSKKKCRDR